MEGGVHSLGRGDGVTCSISIAPGLEFLERGAPKEEKTCQVRMSSLPCSCHSCACLLAMFGSASRLPGRHLRNRHGQPLYRIIPHRTFASSSFALQDGTHTEGGNDPLQIASSSKDADNPTIPSRPSSSSQPTPSVDSWSLRKRLRKLTLRIFPEAGAVETDAKEAWRHPSRVAASDDKLKNRAQKRWDREKILAAEMKAVAGSRKTLRMQREQSRADVNMKKKEAQMLKEANARNGTLAKGESQAGIESQAENKAYPLWADVLAAEGRKARGVTDSAPTSSPTGIKMEAQEVQSRRLTDAFAALDPEKMQRTDDEDAELSEEVGLEEETIEEVTEPSKGSSRKNRRYAERDPAPHLKLAQEDNWESIASTGQRHGRNTYEVRTELIKGASIPYHRKVEPVSTLEGVEMTTASNYLPVDQVPTEKDERRAWWDQEGKWKWTVGGTMSASEVPVKVVEPLRSMEVPQLAHGLDRVLFNPGVHWLRDVRSGIYNFEPRIRNLYDVDLFDYSALPPYQTSSKDVELAELVRRLSKRYSGSTSSMTALLSHIYFLVSAWKQPDLTGYTAGFASLPRTYSYGAKLPASIVLRRFEDQVGGEIKVRYAIDADKSSEGSTNNNYILINLGKSVEKLLTSSPEDYEKYLRLHSHILTKEEKEKKEAYHYAATDKIVMRSQLDCYDERLPRKTFDLKTRAVIAIRQDRANWAESSGYMIRHQTGTFESFEREMWDMTRAALLKYYFQARIGNMDGIMVAYHSTSTVFGFQYLACEDMALKLFGTVEMGEQAFRLSVGFLERLLDTMTDIEPNHVSVPLRRGDETLSLICPCLEQSLKITLDTEQRENPTMFAFVQAVEEGEAEDTVQEGVAVEDGFEETLDPVEDDELTDASAANEGIVADSDAAAEVGAEEEQCEEDGKAGRRHKVLQLDVVVDRYLGDELVKGPVDFTVPSGYRVNEAMEDEISRRKRASLPPLNWSIEYSITPRHDLTQRQIKEKLQKTMQRKEDLAPLILPNIAALNERERLREEELSKDEAVLARFYQDRKSGLAMGMPVAPGQIQAEELKVSVGSKDEDGVDAASADLKEGNEKPVQQWKKRTSAIERLRELARLGKEDKDREALTDSLELYERRGD